MSSLLLAVLKIGFLVLMWLFILFVAGVVRSDLFGRRVTNADLATPKKSTVAPTRITIVSGQAAGDWTALPSSGHEISIGRASSSDLNIHDDYASGHHATLWCDDGGFVIEDNQSTNGTYVNGQQIAQLTRVGAEDDIRIGRSHLRLEA